MEHWIVVIPRFKHSFYFKEHAFIELLPLLRDQISTSIDGLRSYCVFEVRGDQLRQLHRLREPRQIGELDAFAKGSPEEAGRLRICLITQLLL